MWRHHANRGIHETPVRPRQWTLSVAHSEAEAELCVGAFARLLDEHAGG